MVEQTAALRAGSSAAWSVAYWADCWAVRKVVHSALKKVDCSAALWAVKTDVHWADRTAATKVGTRAVSSVVHSVAHWVVKRAEY